MALEKTTGPLNHLMRGGSLPKTYITDVPRDEYFWEVTRRCDYAPVDAYYTPNDVPVPLRHTLKHAYESGVTADNLAVIFDLPATWVNLFVLDAHPA